MRHQWCAWLLGWNVMLMGIPLSGGEKWVEDSFEDFADGQLDASGQNIYISRDGKIRTIHRFDLNSDGYIDLIFNSTHNEYGFIPATLCTVDKGRKRELMSEPLAVEGSKQVAVSDLNRDGWLDLAFCPNFAGIQHSRRFVTLIYGGPDGWPSHRSNGILPVRGAKAIAVADLNQDKWPDIVVLNEKAWLTDQPEGSIVRVYWGDRQGFLLDRRLDLGVPGAIGLTAEDFDGDGAADVAVLRSDKKIQILWSGPSAETEGELQSSHVALPGAGAQCVTAGDCDGDAQPDLIVGTNKQVVHIVRGQAKRAWAKPITVDAASATHVAVGDLDADEVPDLVLTDLSMARAAGGEITGAGQEVADVVRVFWGDKTGFSRSRVTTLPTKYASASAIGDLDNDGRADLAVAVYQSAEAFAAKSVVYFGKGDRQFARGKNGIETEGATDVAIAPAKHEHPARAVFCSSRGGRLHEAVPTLVYWGGKDGFDPKRRWTIPFASGYESSAADLNADGFTELILMNSGHGGRGATGGKMGANIFWGSQDGFQMDESSTALEHYGLWASNVADLNRDGWLDLVLGQFGPDNESEPEHVVVYYGSQDGFDTEHRTMLESDGRSGGCVVADFNRDRWLDIAVTSFNADRVRVFWGSPDGFDPKRQSGLAMPSPIGLETADLNADGMLDLIVGSYQDELGGHHDTGMHIFWGSAEGFRQWDAKWLPGWTPVGLTVADWDGDGYLDLFSPHYHGELTRESMPCYLYWNGPDGFDPRRRTILMGDSADDALAADFNRDGKLDLALVCHTVDGNHHARSRVYYNDGNRFADPETTFLPTHGPHWMWLQDMGHIYHRRWEQRYRSSIHNWENTLKSGTLAFSAEVPEGTTLTFHVRSAADKSELEQQPWRNLRAGKFKLKPADRCLQYRAVFKSDNGDRYPVLDRVIVTLE